MNKLLALFAMVGLLGLSLAPAAATAAMHGTRVATASHAQHLKAQTAKKPAHKTAHKAAAKKAKKGTKAKKAKHKV